jgi:predicted DNA-binding transcriptional regulator YafY
MSRSERLLKLLQVLRSHRRPVSGHSLAGELGVSIRTLYRDIASLQAQGAMIEGEAGVGYTMRPGFMLPPLMFTHQELDALVLGMRLVAQQGDRSLAGDARSLLAKITAVIPTDLRHEMDSSTLLIGAGHEVADQTVDIDQLRAAIRRESKLRIDYRDPSDTLSTRVVWPYAMVYFNTTRVLMCWCEKRDAYRNFRTDRILAVDDLQTRYPKHKQALLREWRHLEHVPGRSLLPETDSMTF